MNDELKQLSALTALNNMMRGGHFSICTVDSVGNLLGIEPRGSDAYKILHTLHCVNWGAMPPKLREAVPGLINECLGIAPAFQFTSASPGKVIELTPDQPKRGIMKMLGLS